MTARRSAGFMCDTEWPNLCYWSRNIFIQICILFEDKLGRFACARHSTLEIPWSPWDFSETPQQFCLRKTVLSCGKLHSVCRNTSLDFIHFLNFSNDFLVGVEISPNSLDLTSVTLRITSINPSSIVTILTVMQIMKDPMKYFTSVQAVSLTLSIVMVSTIFQLFVPFWEVWTITGYCIAQVPCFAFCHTFFLNPLSIFLNSSCASLN